MTDLGTLDSYGMKWMGTVPQNWSISAAKRHFYIRLGKMLQNDPEAENDCTVPYLKAVNVLWGRVNTEDASEMWASPDEIVLYGVRDGDLLVCEGGQAGRAGIVRNPPNRCIIQNAVHRVRARNSGSVSFLMYVLHSVDSSGWFDVLCNRATIAHFTGEKFAELRIPLPSPKTQRAIAVFLDRETSRIDELIAKKQRQIELLQEKRSALISHVVTKGLDPDVKMKASDIDGLEDIPSGWHVLQFRRVISSLEQGWSPVADDRQAEEDEWAVLKISAIAQGRFRSSEHKALPPGLEPEARYEIRLGDFLVTRSNTPERVGDACCVSETRHRLIMSDLIYRLRLDQRRCVHRFACYWLMSRVGRAAIEADAHGTSGSMVKISQSHIRAWPILIPPVEEQNKIVHHLDRELHGLDETVAKIEASIDLLREYRTALISAAVTGKIDVREEAPAS